MKSSKLIFGLAVIALGFTSCKERKRKEKQLTLMWCMDSLEK
jgi:hypothetical protein